MRMPARPLRASSGCGGWDVEGRALVEEGR